MLTALFFLKKVAYSLYLASLLTIAAYLALQIFLIFFMPRSIPFSICIYIKFDTYFIASRMAAPNALAERFNDAVRSMTSIGYRKETVVRILKKLLTVYGHNWVHIEADNYTTLVNALCDADDKNPKVCSPFISSFLEWLCSVSLVRYIVFF